MDWWTDGLVKRTTEAPLIKRYIYSKTQTTLRLILCQRRPSTPLISRTSLLGYKRSHRVERRGKLNDSLGPGQLKPASWAGHPPWMMPCLVP